MGEQSAGVFPRAVRELLSWAVVAAIQAESARPLDVAVLRNGGGQYDSLSLFEPGAVDPLIMMNRNGVNAVAGSELVEDVWELAGGPGGSARRAALPLMEHADLDCALHELLPDRALTCARIAAWLAHMGTTARARRSVVWGFAEDLWDEARSGAHPLLGDIAVPDDWQARPGWHPLSDWSGWLWILIEGERPVAVVDMLTGDAIDTSGGAWARWPTLIPDPDGRLTAPLLARMDVFDHGRPVLTNVVHCIADMRYAMKLQWEEGHTPTETLLLEVPAEGFAWEQFDPDRASLRAMLGDDTVVQRDPSLVPDFVRARIQEPIPDGIAVVPGTTPIVVFGNPNTARVATIGINPSHAEFSPKVLTVPGSDAPRLLTYAAAGCSGPEECSGEQADAIARAAYDYFAAPGYYRWFAPMREFVVKPAGADYEDGSACHLDLSPWATDPVWSKLDDAQRSRLLSMDGAFLRQQLDFYRFPVLLLNGSEVVSWFSANVAPLAEVARIPMNSGSTSTLLQGAYGDAVVLGWTLNVPDAWTSAQARSHLAGEIERRITAM